MPMKPAVVLVCVTLALGACQQQAPPPAPASTAPIVLDCTEIEAEPVWSQTREVSTVVQVTYGPFDEQNQQASVTVQDDDAIEAYGQRLATVPTTLAEQTDALTLANLILTRAAWPQWTLAAVRLPWDALQPETAERLATALPGTRVTVERLPQPAPMAGFPGALEGWQENVTFDTRTIMLWLSHVSHSLAVPTWEAEPAGETWAMLDPSLTWENDL